MDVVEAGQMVITMLLPTMAIGAAVMTPRVVRSVRRRLGRWGADLDLEPVHPPIEKLAADLRRLLQRHDALMRSTDVAMRARHLRAIEAAIGDCAAEAALALDLPCPSRSARAMMPTAELRLLLRALAGAGLVLVPATGLYLTDGHT